MNYVIDISKWQSTYNAETAKAAGVNEVILRCAYGTSKDICFDEFYATAKAAGQTIGAYGFATWHYSSKNGGSIDAARAVMHEQVDAWIEYCAGKLDGWFAIDQEMESDYSMGLSAANNMIIMNEAITRLEAAGLTVCVYCSASWVTAYLDAETLNAPLWVAYYYADPNDPDFDGVADYSAQTGTYFVRMQGWDSMGKLAGWQFGRIGYGAKYGVASANVDKNQFYMAASGVTLGAFSDDAVSIKITNWGDNFALISEYIGSLGIVCYTATMGNGYFVTGKATAGDQALIRTLCAKYGADTEAYYEPVSVEPIRMAIAWHTTDILTDIWATLGVIGLAGDQTVLDGWVVTDYANEEQQAALLEKIDMAWGDEWFIYTPLATEPEQENTPAPEVEPEEEIETTLAVLQAKIDTLEAANSALMTENTAYREENEYLRKCLAEIHETSDV